MPSLERRLGLFSIITISISSMIGSGIFVLPGLGFEITGPSVFLAFLCSSICILPAAMCKAELATAMPTSGGTYVYVDRTFGPLVGTITGLGLFLSILLKASFALIGIGAYFSLLSTVSLMPLIISFLFIIILLNIFGIGKVSTFLTVILFITMTSLTVLCVFSFPLFNFSNFDNLLPNGWKGLANATALVFVSYAGVTKIAAIAEEVKSPEKNLPRGILVSLFLVTIIYSAVSFVLAAVYNYQEISGELTPLYRLAKDVGGSIVGSAMAVIATLTMANTANAGVLAASRFPFAMARDNLLPKKIGTLHKKFLTPVVSIILSGIVIAVVLLNFDVTKIAKLASAFMILGYIIVNIAVIVLRETRVQWYKPTYKSPLYPGLQIFGILSGVLLLGSMGKLALIAVSVISLLGTALYTFYSRKKVTRKGVVGIRGKRTDLIETNSPEHARPGTFCNFEPSGNAEVVVTLFGREKSADMLIEMGVAMVEHSHIEVAQIIEVPEQTDLYDVIEEPGDLKSLRRRIMAMAKEKDEWITFDPVVSHDVSKTIYEISHSLHCQWLLLEWGGRSRGAFTVHNPIGWLKSHLHCNLATFRDAGVRYIRKIVVLINNDEHDKLALTTANHLAKVFSADVTLTKFSHKSSSEESKNFEQSFLKELAQKLECTTNTKVLVGETFIPTVLKETCEYDLFILGSKSHGFKEAIFGSTDDKLIAQASCSVLSVHAPDREEIDTK